MAVMTSDDAQLDEAFRAAMRRLIAERWDAVWEQCPDVLAGKEPEAVHDLRVASRRLRAAMDVAAGCFPARWYRSLHRSAKSLTQALGDVRDLDVMLEALVEERDRVAAEEQPGADQLIAKIRRKRKKARKKLVAFLEDLEQDDVRDETRRRFAVDEARHPDHAGGAS